ncbi:MAG: nucleoside triphosphate pyrophosphatase [Pseudomonadota bacterium]
MKLVLASGSAWRLELMHAAGIPCTAVPPAIREHDVAALDPVDLACTRALAKARDVGGRCGADCWVIGADQVVHLGGEVFGKPADDAEHLAMLRRLRGRTHQLVTGVALVVGALDASRGDPQAALSRGGTASDGSNDVALGRPCPAERCLCEITRLTMRADLTDDELRAYVACGEARACGGGYMVERRGIQLFERIDGDWTNVVGLPIIRLVGELRSLGWRPTFGSGGEAVAP